MEEETRQVIFETNGKTYWELYVELVETRRRNPIPDGVPFEVHHIRPKSIFQELVNDPSNLIRLTPKEHAKAHFLLWMHYKYETDDKDGERKMRFAFWRMVNGVEWEGDAELEWIGERFEELRADFVESISGENSPTKRPEVRAKMSQALRGENNPSKRPEVRAKLSEAMKGENHPMYGKHHSEETRAKMSQAAMGREVSDETRAKFMGENNPSKRPEVRAKLSEAMKGRFAGDKNPMKNPEIRAKFMGENNPRSKKVLQFAKDGTFLAEFSCTREAERKTNVQNAHISLCCNGKRKTAGGYVWKYAEPK